MWICGYIVTRKSKFFHFRVYIKNGGYSFSLQSQPIVGCSFVDSSRSLMQTTKKKEWILKLWTFVIATWTKLIQKDQVFRKSLFKQIVGVLCSFVVFFPKNSFPNNNHYKTRWWENKNETKKKGIYETRTMSNVSFFSCIYHRKFFSNAERMCVRVFVCAS